MNWLPLCDQEYAVQGLLQISQHLYRRFSLWSSDMCSQGLQKNYFLTKCHVVRSCKDIQDPLHKATRRKFQRASQCWSTLETISQIHICSPAGLKEETKRIIFEEGRTNKSGRFLALNNLLDFISADGVDELDLGLFLAAECKPERPRMNVGYR